MALTQNLMAFGQQAFAAQAIVGDVANNLTGLGTNQATALALTAVNNTFTTTASGTGCLLPPMQAGDTVIVNNLGATNALLVYPRGTATIQTGSASAGFSVATGKSAQFTARDNSGNCTVILSA